MKEENPLPKLKEIYFEAVREVKKDKGKDFIEKLDIDIKDNLILITDKSESFKAVISVLITSLTKKILNPKQDIRLHKVELNGGYSGRTFDTKYITPFLKEKFTRLSMKESGWLTRSLEQVAPFDLNFPGKIRDSQVKKAFLEIINSVEEKKSNPNKILIALFILLINKTDHKKLKIKHIKNSDSATINLIMDSLHKHFFTKYSVSGASRLPVIALYSIYDILIRDLKRYSGKRLLPLKSHIASDKKSKDIGDVTIVDKEGGFFEGVEVKHGIKINKIMVDDSFEKLKNTETSRYYLLSTSDPNIKDGEEEIIKETVDTIRETHGCEIIVNGLMNSLKYYLRLLTNPSEFIEKYTENLEKDFAKTTEIKNQHVEAWRELLVKNFS
jgi:DNA (cytosine-5)-methyltransferase 1